MKKNYGSLLLRNLTGFGLVVALILTSSMVSLASGGALSGEITVSGQRVDGVSPAVSLNGENVLSGRTFFNSAVISTPETSSATINLGKLGRISMSPNTSLSLTLADNSISGDLTSGSVQVFNAEGVAVSIRGNEDSVTNDASQAGEVSVDVTSGSTVATSTESAVYVNGEPAAAQMSKKKKRRWIIFGVIAGVVATALIIYAVTRDDDDVTSPRR